jgi:ribosome-binding protein aMBF1 (putative translation factor)
MPIAIFVKGQPKSPDAPVVVLGLMSPRLQEPRPTKPGAVSLIEPAPAGEATAPQKTRTAWGQIIKSIRIEQGLSQRQLAELSGVNRNVLRRLENEGGSSSVDVLERLAEILGYEFDLHCISKTLN